jgi:hypothetical protein
VPSIRGYFETGGLPRWKEADEQAQHFQ